MPAKRRKSKLEQQCDSIGWPIHVMHAPYLGSGRWLNALGGQAGAEDIVGDHLIAAGRKCCWCEGGSIKTLMKAACLDVLDRENLFEDRQDAIRRYLEAQFVVLANLKSEIVSSIRNISSSRLLQNIEEICADDVVRSFFPRVTSEFVAGLAQSIDASLIAELAAKFMENPYEYRAGWPDLTVIGQSGIALIEVKTTDCLHTSQLRFADCLARPLGLNCRVVQLRPTVPDHCAC